jgi:Tol biopolymer transport system component/DNA-binding winged helix-turn-helix (wHTH) protein
LKMPPPGTHGEIYRFGAFELASGPGELRKHGVRLKLQDQPVRLLILLLENAGEVVTREQIQKSLWADDVHVDYENAINSTVRKLREVLIDTSDNPRFVETLARRGYRFIAAVSRMPPLAAVTPTEIPPIAPFDVKEPAFGAPEASPQASARTTARKLPWLLLTGALVAIAALVGAAFWFEHGRGSSEPPLRAVPLTAYPGSVSTPSFSPDGNQVAFVWNGEKGDNEDIYVQWVGSGKPLRLTTDPGRDLYPAWSPDGRRIAFVRIDSNQNTSLLLIPALGGAEREVAQLGSFNRAQYGITMGGWTPDGRWLLLSMKEGSDRYGLFLLSVESGEKRRLTSPPAVGTGDMFGSISPDGRAIAFSRVQSNGAMGGAAIGDVYMLLVTPDFAPKGEPRRLTFDGAGIGGVAWTADSREIVFSSNRSGSVALWRIPRSGSEKPRRLAAAEGANGSFAISPRANRLVYSQAVPMDSNIWRLDLANPGSPPIPLIASTRQDYRPRYSPDGKRIAFNSDRAGASDIWGCDADGANATQLTERGNSSGSPRWSYDGRQIAFDSVAGGSYQIFVVASHGGQSRQLTFDNTNVRPSWSHDGKWIYFASSRTGRFEVWKMPVGGGIATQLSRNGGANQVESEDGAAIYYTSVNGTGSLMTAAVDGGGETTLAKGVDDFAVARDGIYYHARPPDNSLLFLSFASGTSRQIVNLAVGRKTGQDSMGLSVSPDGRWLLYTQVDSRAGSDLMLVENFH